MGPIGALLLITAGITLFILAVIFILVPLFRGIGWLIANFFKGIGWLITHIFRFIAGMIGDTLRFIGAILAGTVLVPLTLVNVVIGRWSAAGHFAGSVKREFRVAGACLYRVLLQRPLRLVLLDGLLEGIEQRVPEAMAGASTADRPSHRIGQFEGYAIVGSLRGGGSGAKLYIAEPNDRLRQRGFPQRVVIKSFAMSEGSSLPQIVRESRALECAKQLGLVLEHGMDEQRFFYVMPYHAGDHLGIVTRQMHGESGEKGLGPRQLETVLAYTGDLVQTLATYHRGGLWHKDVKPDNVIVRDGQAHLVDLGLVTPLRSAMTLTTHGTEYFRDPEMVRQALRGVKVHQVNGAKFDIYAVGAVLYFMLENTFPAHGALSRFSKKSPEAVRWIVKRSMTDYNQRYQSADEMLADLEHVSAASDAFVVRPADLPSMRGEAPPPMPEEPAVVNHAGSPMPPRQPASPAEAAQAAAAAAAASVAQVVQPGKRQKLTVTNWWTGEYSVEGAATSAAAGPTEHSAFRSHSREFNQQMRDLRHQVRKGMMSSRRAAREQIKDARRRAREIRARVSERRSAVTKPREPSGFLAVLVLLAVGAGVVGAFLLLQPGRRSSYAPSVAIEVMPRSSAFVFGGDVEDGIPVLLINHHPDAHQSKIEREVERIIKRRRDEGYHVVGTIFDPELYVLFDEWIEDSDDDYVDGLLEDELEEHHLYGVLHITEGSRHGTGKDRVDHTLVSSTRDGAQERRRPDFGTPIPGLPFLLVNDHPTKNDPRVQECVQQVKDLCASHQWEVIVDDDTEVAIRQAMPTGGLIETEPVPVHLARVMTEQGLAGVIRIDARPGEGDAGARVRTTLIPAPVLIGEEAAAEAAAVN